MRTIDREYQQKYNEYLPLINSVLRNYYDKLDREELKSAGMVALFDCIRNFNPERAKFITILTLYVRWECIRRLKEKIKYKDNEQLYDRDYEDGMNCKMDFFDIFSELTIDENEILINRYIGKMTMKELELKYGISKEKIRRKLKRIKNKLLEMHSCV